MVNVPYIILCAIVGVTPTMAHSYQIRERVLWATYAIGKEINKK